MFFEPATEKGHWYTRMGREIMGFHQFLKWRIWLKGLAVIALAVGLSLTIKLGGLVVALCLLLLPFLFALVVLVLEKPKIGLLISLHASFVVNGLGRYVTNIPFGLAIDILLLLTALRAFSIASAEDWQRIPKGLLWVCLGWFGFTALEILNPEAPGIVAWVYAIRSTSFQMLLAIVLTALLFKKPKEMNQVIYLWFFWSVLACLYGMKQLYVGLNNAENAWLAAGAAKTHLLFGRLRVFSFYSDAASFGSSQAHAGLAACILAFRQSRVAKQLMYAVIALICFYGMIISGTRGALFVVIIGFAAYLLLSNNIKVLIIGSLIGLTMLGLLKFTYVGNSNYQINRMRTALDPNDPSLVVRLNNQKLLANYLSSRPLGGGIGCIGFWGERFNPNGFLGKIPTDSWYVRIWAETGIIGLYIYLSLMGYLIVAGFKKVWRVKAPELQQSLMAFYAGMVGIIVASYGNELWAQLPIAPLVYVSVAFVFQAQMMEQANKIEG
ncbi:MAG: O-antigen ligase family protein [Bacteroidota bacterium]